MKSQLKLTVIDIATSAILRIPLRYVNSLYRHFPRACGCGEVFGFEVADALEYLGKSNKGMENALRSLIRTSHLGCNGVRIDVGEVQPKGSHIQRKKLPEGLIQNLDKVFPDAKKQK
ncbi:Hypothetical predicted protein [Paramuricea clavata]|uniref:Uncharacterized protein n=1 Tax=Paramuricea clavata TaxID=317549 RepID=A0A7D9L4B2_PARCT|nr:Hypothetical predicted protein [Paramuricea clavata]